VKVLITGAGGQVATALSARPPAGVELTNVARSELDIADPEQVRRVLSAVRPDAIINAAAYTAVDRAESEPERAREVNETGPRNIAEIAAQIVARVLHLSTDFVFDGAKMSPYTEADRPAPLSVYGMSKLAGEQAVREVAARWVIARTAWLYGVHGRNFVKTILGKAATGETLRVVSDQVGSPTYARDLAEALVRLIQQELTGTFHLTNSGACSWYDFRREILRRSGFGNTPVLPISSQELGRPARRPAYSVLANVAWVTAGEVPLRPWPEALADMLQAWHTADPSFPRPCE